MNSIYILDDDLSIINILKIIIEESNCTKLCGYAVNAQDAMEDFNYFCPEIVIVDLLMPAVDGITFVKEALKIYPKLHFIMLSQVSNKELVAKAYETGIEFFIHKPVNSIEVTSVLKKAVNHLQMEKTIQEIQSILTPDGGSLQVFQGQNPSGNDVKEKIQTILKKLGLGGEPGFNDILQITCHIISCHEHHKPQSIAELCTYYSKAPKSMEQRMRRAVSVGLNNLAHMGIEDYQNEVFTEYSGTLYKFEHVRKEMDYIKGNSVVHGKAGLKNFLYNLASFCQ